MKQTSINCFLVAATCLFTFCSIGNAEIDSSAGQLSKRSKRLNAPIQLAQKAEANSKNASTQKQQPKQQPPITKQRRAEIFSFLKKHHAAIRPLLVSLEKNQPEKFQTALQKLDREVKYLQALAQRGPKARYEKSLEHWICKSKIELLSAQLALKKNEEQKAAIKKELRSLITKRHDLRVSLLADDAAVTKKRLDTIQAQLKNLRSTRGKTIQDQFAAIVRVAERRAADAMKKKNNKRPAPSTNKKNKQQDNKPNPKKE